MDASSFFTAYDRVLLDTVVADERLRIGDSRPVSLPAQLSTSDVVGVMLTVDVVDPSASGSLHISGAHKPLDAVSYGSSSSSATTFVAVEPDGPLTFKATSSTDLRVRVTGVVKKGGGFTAVAPTRLVDGKKLTDTFRAPLLSTRKHQASPTGWALLRVQGRAVREATLSTGKFVAMSLPEGQRVSGLVWAPVGSDGEVELTPSAAATLTVDYVGWMADGARLTSLPQPVMVSSASEEATHIKKTSDGASVDVAGALGDGWPTAAGSAASFVLASVEVRGSESQAITVSADKESASTSQGAAHTRRMGGASEGAARTVMGLFPVSSLGTMFVDAPGAATVNVTVLGFVSDKVPTEMTVDMDTYGVSVLMKHFSVKTEYMAPGSDLVMPAPAGKEPVGACTRVAAGNEVMPQSIYLDNAWHITLGNANFIGEIRCHWATIGTDGGIVQTVQPVQLQGSGTNKATFDFSIAQTQIDATYGGLALIPGVRYYLESGVPGTFTEATTLRMGTAEQQPITESSIDIMISADGSVASFTMPDAAKLRDTLGVVSVAPNLVVLATPGQNGSPGSTVTVVGS